MHLSPRYLGIGRRTIFPDPEATGAHTILGERTGSDGAVCRQGATFDKEGKFIGTTDVTNHRRADHPNPHFHPAKGPGGSKRGAHPLPDPKDFQ